MGKCQRKTLSRGSGEVVNRYQPWNRLPLGALKTQYNTELETQTGLENQNNMGRGLKRLYKKEDHSRGRAPKGGTFRSGFLIQYI